MSALDKGRPAIAPARSGFHLDRANAKVFGVCAGIGEFTGIDPMWVRIAFAAGTILGVGILIPVYLAIALIAD